MSTRMSSDPSIARGDFRTSVSLNFGFWHSKPLVRASALIRTYGRLLHIPTFSGHELFPVILEKRSIREMASKELCFSAYEQCDRDPIRSRTRSGFRDQETEIGNSKIHT